MRLRHAAAVTTLALGMTGCAAAMPAAGQAATYKTGVGDNNPAMFSSPFYKALKTRITRYIAPYNLVTTPSDLATFRSWLAGADRRPRPAADRLLPLPRPRHQAAERGDLHDRHQEVHEGLPVDQELHAVERGEPRQRDDQRRRLLRQPDGQAVGRLLRRPEEGLQGLHDRRLSTSSTGRIPSRRSPTSTSSRPTSRSCTRRCRRSGACTTTPTPTASATPARRTSSPPSRARSG